MWQQYFPILMFIVMALMLGVVLIALGLLLSPSSPSKEKLAEYECGFPAFSSARLKFDVRYYLVAILFIIFDLEIAFLFPWAVVNKQVGMPALIAVMIFLGLLTVGFIYEWRKGALEWE
jgi:NADH-quinone oxidoreductase subunit A